MKHKVLHDITNFSFFEESNRRIIIKKILLAATLLLQVFVVQIS